MPLQTRTVTGLYRDLVTGQLAAGEVQFDPYPGVWHDVGGEEVRLGGQVVQLVDGAFTQALVPTEGLAGVDPSGGRLWRITERVTGQPARARYFALPLGDESPVDVTQLVVAEPGALTYLPIVSGGGGTPTGPAGGALGGSYPNPDLAPATIAQFDPAGAAAAATAGHAGTADAHGDRAWADGRFEQLLGVPRPSRHGFRAWTYDPATADLQAVTVSGTLYLAALFPALDATSTALHWFISTAGASPVAGQNWVGLYDSAGVLLASAGVDGDVASTGAKASALAVPLLGGQQYWAAFLFNAATPPALPRGGEAAQGSALNNINLSPGVYRFATNGTGRTALPSSIAPGSNVAGSSYWAAVA